MLAIDAMKLSDDDLLAFHDMMTDACLKIEKIAPLAMTFWGEVLRELDTRGRVELISGSYDDIGNARIRRVR